MKTKTKKQNLFAYWNKTLLCCLILSISYVFMGGVNAQGDHQYQFYADPYTVCERPGYTNLGRCLDSNCGTDCRDEMCNYIDVNGDGVVDSDDYIDVNGDGVINSNDGCDYTNNSSINCDCIDCGELKELEHNGKYCAVAIGCEQDKANCNGTIDCSGVKCLGFGCGDVVLDGLSCLPFDCSNINDYTPAEIIYLAAKINDINPVLLISKLQDEQNLIDYDDPNNEYVLPNDPSLNQTTFNPNNSYHLTVLEWKLTRATGYDMKDNNMDNPKFYGFYAQVMACANQFHLFREGGWKEKYTDTDTNIEKYKCGSPLKNEFSVAFGKYSTNSVGYTNFRDNIYPKFANAMNTIVGTGNEDKPDEDSSDYYDDFRDEVTSAHIQQLLDEFEGPLSNFERGNSPLPLFSKTPQQNPKSFNLSNMVSHLYWPFEEEYRFNVGNSNNIDAGDGWYNRSADKHIHTIYPYGDIKSFDYYYSGNGGACGKKIFAPLSGTVIYKGNNGNKYGNQIIIQSNIDASFVFRIAHLESFDSNISVGEIVDIKQELGTVGNTGKSGNDAICHAHCVLYKRIDSSALTKLTNGESLIDYFNVAAFWFDAAIQVQPTTLISPINEPEYVNPLNFKWTSMLGATNYRIQVSTSVAGWSETDGFPTSITSIDGVDGTTSALLPIDNTLGNVNTYNWNDETDYTLQPGQTYYWSVKTYYPSLGAIWSEPISFKIDRCMTLEQNNSVSLEWLYCEDSMGNRVASKTESTTESELQYEINYTIQISRYEDSWTPENGFTSSYNTISPDVPVNFPIGSDIFFNWDPMIYNYYPPKSNTTYYWSIKTDVDIIPDAYETWSEPWSFTTGYYCEYPHAIVTVHVGANTYFFWEGNGDCYELILAPYGTNNWSLYGCYDTNSLIGSNFEPGMSYQGALRSYCNGVPTGWVMFYFTPNSAKADESTENVEADFVYVPQTRSIDIDDIPLNFTQTPIETNLLDFINISPNPVRPNQNLNIVFNLPEESEKSVQIEIYNINSEKIQSKKLTDLNIGINKVDYQLGNLSPGVYICLITTENKQYSKKFVVSE